ncbi:MAG TPA: Rossmann-like and DUF2520 domain-containing protein [Ktedonobacterales bacterium]|nr:Rossmann-like and DUF2520 domain-containing protein [Ktedonobacterales bacterium]
MTTTDDSDGMNGTPARMAALGNVGVIGSGAVGGSLARALADSRAKIIAVTARNGEHAAALARRIPGCRAVATPAEVVAASDLILLAAPDDTITPLAESLSWRAGQRVVHFSGARGAQALAAAAERGATVAALHPLMTFTRALAAGPLDAILARLRGCVWALETEDEALREALRAMVAALGGQVALLTESGRIPYHIAGVLASNYVVTLMGAATALWESFGADRALAREALLPLMRASVENLTTLEPSAALSGPIARGDVGTIRAHLDWLASAAASNPEMVALRDAYLALARLAIPLAEAKGTLSPAQNEALHALLDSDA